MKARIGVLGDWIRLARKVHLGVSPQMARFFITVV